MNNPYYDEKRQFPVLVSEKAAIILVGGLMSTVYFPMVLFQDIASYEIAVKKLDPKKYGREVSPMTFVDMVIN
jgi:hypothetical protein